MYTFTVKRLRTVLASAVAIVTFENDGVAGDEVCYHRLPCCVGVNSGGTVEGTPPHYVTGKCLNI